MYLFHLVGDSETRIVSLIDEKDEKKTHPQHITHNTNHNNEKQKQNGNGIIYDKYVFVTDYVLSCQ